MKLEKEVIMQNTYTSDLSLIIKFVKTFTDKETKLLRKMQFKKVKLTLEIEEPILDDAERKYLSGVIRPFRNRICSIVKEGYSNIEYIQIKYDKVGNINTYFSLPSFKVGTMYKGMELNKKYTLKELGL